MALLKRTISSNPDFIYLIKHLDKELWDTYNSFQFEYATHNKIDHIDTVVLLYKEKKAVGCGCFKKYNYNTIEIKRMFVENEYRGNGYSKQILKELEKWSLEIGYSNVILETGDKQYAAISLYNRLGYEKTINYGQYDKLPHSFCFKKRLIKI